MMKSYPKVSVLVPARNEESNLPALFGSLEKLNYPTEDLEILLGNDSSEDATGVLMDEFAAGKPYVKVFHLDNSPSELKGKTRVLDSLIQSSIGEYLFFTDADIVLSSTWIQGMLKEFDKNVGVVVGATGFHNTSLYATLLGTEWLMALSMYKIAADFGVPSTGLGNNMAVSREAYDAIGGYRKIGFSIVEDYLLYIRIIEAGFSFKHAFEPSILSYTVPPTDYFKQRRRWIQGAMQNAPLAMMGGILQALSIPLLIVLGLVNWKISVVIVLVLLATYFCLINYFERKLNVRGYLKVIPAFSIYISVAWFLQFMYFLFSKKTIWKGRQY